MIFNIFIVTLGTLLVSKLVICIEYVMFIIWIMIMNDTDEKYIDIDDNVKNILILMIM